MNKNEHGHTFESQSKPQWVGTQISLLHVVVVLLSLAMTIGAWQFSKNQIETRIETRFQTARDRTLDLIAERMLKYEDALWAGVSAMNSHNNTMSRDQWRHFAQTLRIDEKYPGINGIGVIHFVSGTAMPNYLAERRSERPGFTIYPPRDAPVSIPISFIEPDASNTAAVGLDIAHETNRRTAALASRDTGKAQITGPIVLVQDAGNTPGFLFYAPFYKGGTPSTISQRQQDIIGAVYAPFVVRKLMQGLLAKDLRDVRFRIKDAEQTIYNEHTTTDPLADPAPMHSQTIDLNVYGRTWTIDLRTNLAFRAANTYDQPTVILLGGLLIEALIVALLFMMSRANHHAVAYADKVTAKLKEKSQKLESTNLELEQFVYVASHDLKTPIRGIGGLTEMLREDLEDYLKSPDANVEIDKNLNRIQDRVTRMNELTQGVMAISKIGKQPQSAHPLLLRDIIADLKADFDLPQNALTLTGNVSEVTVDPFNFRRVLENLVSNAVKYHCGTHPLQIEVSVNTARHRLNVCVKDNGPGIAPQFHQRIFQVFQTLRLGDDPESNGIGLAIVKKTVETHGGKINLTSALTKGACFTFDWPAKACPPIQANLKKAA